MRTFPKSLVDKNTYYEQLGQTSKRAFNFTINHDPYKDEMESLEETDTEKHFKKVNTSSWKRPNRCHFGNNIPQKVEVATKDDKAEQMEKYKRMYEIEKLRYGEERSKYFY